MKLHSCTYSKMRLFCIGTVMFMVSSTTLLSQENKLPVDEQQALTHAADQATNPLAFVTKFQIQPNYTLLDNDGDELNLIFRIMQPSKTIGLPFIKSKHPEKIYTIYRLEAPIISQTVPDNATDATGLSDLIFIDVIAFTQKWGVLGIGPALSMPTASSTYLGSGKWSPGLAGVILYKKIPKFTVGALVQQFVSVAGDENRNDVNHMLLQPVITQVFNKGVFLNFSPIIVLDWENEKYNIPIGLNIGKAFAKTLSMFIGPEYVVSGPGKGDFTIRLNINTMFLPTK